MLKLAQVNQKQNLNDFSQFHFALQLEVVACLFLAIKRNYCIEDMFKKLYDSYKALCKMITKLKDSI